MISFSSLPAVNATLNGMSAIFLVAGFRYIRQKNRAAHERYMKAAVVTSALFLICYITYHLKAGRTVFTNPAWFRPIYLTLLLTHTVLAVTIVPLIIITLNRALRQRFDAHRKIARWTWPLWMYVSVTGVIIYLLLYRIFPQ
jgi:putative membrane protein